MDAQSVLVIGGGISGLTFAWHAARAGRKPRVLEAGPRLGGCLDSRRGPDGFWFELGAHTLYNSYRSLLEVRDGCPSPPALVPRNQARKRFGFLRDGALTTMGPLSVFKQFRWTELIARAPGGLFARKAGKTTREHFSRVVGPRNYQQVLAPFLSAVPSQAVDDFPAEGPGSLFKKRPRRKDIVKSFTFDGGEDHFAFGIRETQGQNFRHEGADLAWREIYDGGDLAAEQSTGCVILGDLGRGFLDADLRAEIDLQLEGRLPRFRKGIDANDGADHCTFGCHRLQADQIRMVEFMG